MLILIKTDIDEDIIMHGMFLDQMKLYDINDYFLKVKVYLMVTLITNQP